MRNQLLLASGVFLSVLMASGGVCGVEEYDVVIYGSTPAAIAAAVQTQRMGLRAVVVSPERRIGGLTTGGLGQTDIGNKHAFGGIVREFYRAVADYYRQDGNWRWQRRDEYLPDGQCEGTQGADTMWTFEPSAALKILEGWEKRDALAIRRGERLDRSAGKVRISDDGGRRRIVSFSTENGREYAGKVFVDATYEGDLMAAGGVSYAVGREPNAQYGESLNGVQTANAVFHQFAAGVDPYVVKGDASSGLLPGVERGPIEPDGTGDRRVQAYCFRMCLTDRPENRIPFIRPRDYDERTYELLFRNFEAGERGMPWINSRMPNGKTDTNNRTAFSTDFIGRNWNWPEASYAERETILREHLNYQQGLMWTLANHTRVPAEIRREVARWGTCKDEFADGFGNGWQTQLYVREARRLIGEYVMTEANCRGRAIAGRPVALAAYSMDSHNMRRYVAKDGFVRNEGDVEVGLGGRPFPIDYRALVPRRGECANLLVPVCLSASHIAFGSIRMEPVFFALGQAAGTAAAQAVRADCAVQDLPYGPLAERLRSDGQVLEEAKGDRFGAAGPFTVLPLCVELDKTTEEIAETIREIHQRAGVAFAVLHAPGHGVRVVGAFDEAGYRNVGRRVKAVQDAVRATGVQVGFLMGPTVNVGINHPWTTYVRQDGSLRPFTACPGDARFQQTFARHCAAVAEECHPFLHMMEDDFRLWGECYCAGHLARFGEATGRNWTRQDLLAAFAKTPKLKEDYEKMCLDDLVALAKGAAEAIHRVSPETRVGLSAPGGYRQESARIARALADGHRPFVRWYGTEYGFDNPMQMPDFLWTPLWCKQNLSDGMECVYEADAAPNTAFYGSGTRVAASASVMLANGFDGLWYWLAQVGATATGNPVPNLEAYERLRRNLSAVGACAKEGQPVGVSAMSPSAGRLLARMGIPYRTTPGGVRMYAGADAFAGLTSEEIRQVLSGRILIDGEAARTLTELGFADAIGARAWTRPEAVDFCGECIRADGSLVTSCFHQSFGFDDTPVCRLEPVAGDELSYYYGMTVSNRVQSAVVRHANALGGRVVVLAVALKNCRAANVLDFRKRDLLIEALTWLGGESAVPVRTDRNVNLMVFANEDAARTRLFVHVTQLSCDSLTSLPLVVAPPYRGGRVEYLQDGVWTPLSTGWSGTRVVIPRTMHVYDTTAVRIFRKP